MGEWIGNGSGPARRLSARFQPQNGLSGRIDPFGSRRGVRSDSEFEFGLGGGSCRCDRWRPRRQTDAFEVGPDRGRLRQGSNDLHATAASGAFADVDREHARQELTPGEAVRTRLAVGFAGRLGLVVGARHDPVAVARVGPQDAVVANQVEPWRGYEGSQFFEQLVGGQQQVGCAGTRAS